MYAHRISLLTLLLALAQHHLSAVLLSDPGVNDATALVTGDVVGVPKGTGYCTKGFLHGWDGKGLASAQDCIKLCSAEPGCGFVSYCSPTIPQCAGPRLPGTCSRFSRKESCGPLRNLQSRGSSAFHTSYEVQGKSAYIATVIAATKNATNRRMDASEATKGENPTAKELESKPPLVPKPQPLQDDVVEDEEDEEEPTERGEAGVTSQMEASNVTNGGPPMEVSNAIDAGPPRNEVNATDAEKKEDAEVEVTAVQAPVQKKVGLEEEADVTDDEVRNITEKATSEIEKALEEEDVKPERELTNDEPERELTKAEKKAKKQKEADEQKAKKQKETDEQKATEKRDKLELKKQKDRAKKEEALKKEAQKKKDKEEKLKEKEKEKDKDKEQKSKIKLKEAKGKKSTMVNGSKLPEEALMPAGQENEAKKEEPIKNNVTSKAQLVEHSRRSRLMRSVDELESEESAAAERKLQAEEDAARRAAQEEKERAEEARRQEEERVKEAKRQEEERAEEARKRVETIAQASAAKKARKEAAELLEANRAAVEVAAQEAIKHLHAETDAAEKARIQTEALGKAAEEAGAKAKALERAQKRAAEKARRETEARQKAEDWEAQKNIEKEQADQAAAKEGKLTVSQKQEIHQAFDLFDKDANGHLDTAESKVAVLMTGGLPLHKDGTVGYPEFLKAMRRRILKQQKEEGAQLGGKTENEGTHGASAVSSNDEVLAKEAIPAMVDLSLKRQRTQGKRRVAAKGQAADLYKAETGTAKLETERAEKVGMSLKRKRRKGSKQEAAQRQAADLSREEEGKVELQAKSEAKVGMSLKRKSKNGSRREAAERQALEVKRAKKRREETATNPPTPMDVMTEKLRYKSPEKVGLSLKRQHRQGLDAAQRKAAELLRAEDAKAESQAKQAKKLQKEKRKQAKKAFKDMQTKSMQGGNMTETATLCRCVTPSKSQTAGHNEFKCTDGSSGACGEKEACFAKDPFYKGDSGNSCRKALKKKQKD